MNTYDALISGYAAIFESIDVMKPRGVRYYKKTNNKGTNNAFQSIHAKWTTSLGNVVDLALIPQFDGTEVVFSVNGTYDDSASGDKDREILPTVIYMMRVMLDREKVSNAKIVARQGAGDHKVATKLPMNDSKERFEAALRAAIVEAEKSMSKEDLTRSPTEKESRMLMLLKKSPEQFDPCEKYKNYIKRLEYIHEHMEDVTWLKNHVSFTDAEADFVPMEIRVEFNDAGTDYRRRMLSNNGGFEYTQNRRYPIYKRLISREFSDWNIEYDDKFHTIHMTR